MTKSQEEEINSMDSENGNNIGENIGENTGIQSPEQHVIQEYISTLLTYQAVKLVEQGLNYMWFIFRKQVVNKIFFIVSVNKEIVENRIRVVIEVEPHPDTVKSLMNNPKTLYQVLKNRDIYRLVNKIKEDWKRLRWGLVVETDSDSSRGGTVSENRGSSEKT